MVTPDDLRKHREQLAGMILELQANQVTLEELRKSYGMFVFTGGDIPMGRYGVEAMTSYLERPLADDHALTGEIERYRHLAAATADLGQGPVAPRPRTLRCRKGIGNSFGRLSSEMRTLGTILEAVLTRMVEELGRLSPLPSTAPLLTAGI